MMNDDEEDVSYRFDPAAAKATIEEALNTLSKTSPSNAEVKQHNAAILSLLKHEETLPVLLELLLAHQDSSAKSTLIMTFVSNYLNGQTKAGIAVTRHNSRKIYSTLKECFFLDSLGHKYKKMLERQFIRYLSCPRSEFIKLHEDLTEFIVQYFHEHFETGKLRNILYLVRVALNVNMVTHNFRRI